MSSDGKVVISTELDNSGFEKGIKTISGQLGGLGNTLKNIAAMLAAAFSTKKIIEFATESSQAARTMSDALTGLKSILEGQGRSFSDAQDFIEAFVDDGLIPATNAINAYKNLASRGYDDSQIKQVMTALKDASAYGRQASYTMGEAVESATEGLKNENSILVDNAGVTKNVAKMWDEYAASIGTTANNLTQQQKIQAEVSGILKETKYQTGDAATVAGTLSGQLQQLSFRFNDLKVAVGNAINPIIQTLLPIINTAITSVTKFANAVASVVGALFGKASVQTSTLANSNDSVASSASAGAEAEEELEEAITAAGKAAKKSLASFDELNILQSNTGSGESPSGTSGGSVSSGLDGKKATIGIDVQDNATEKIQTIIDNIKQKFQDLKNKLTGLFQPTIDSWGSAFTSLSLSIEGTASRIGAAWTTLWDNSLAPFGNRITTEWIPCMTNTFSETFAPILEDTMPVAMDTFATEFENRCLVVEKALDQLEIGFDNVETAFTDMCTSISENWNTYGDSILTEFTEFADGVWEIWWDIYDKIIDPILTACSETFDWLWEKHLKPLWDNIVEFALSVAENALALWNGFLKPLRDKLIAQFAPIITTVFNGIGEAVAVAVAIISDVVGAILKFFDGLIQFVVGVFTLDWERAWGGVGKMFQGIWGGMIAVVTGVANSIIWVVNQLVALIYSTIAGVVNSFGKAVETVGKLVGQSWGFSIPHSPPKIPYLAQGAVLPPNKPFLAMVGDQSHGTNIEAPVSTIQDALAEVLSAYGGSGDEAVIEKLDQILGAILSIEVGDTTIGKAANRYNEKMAIIKGRA